MDRCRAVIAGYTLYLLASVMGVGMVVRGHDH
jgi:hypothetical protein